jgi:zinc protease
MLLFAGPADARLDLAAATVERLDNGLTVAVLEDHSFPVVSVQILYRVGARNEQAGATGLAHFLEHMAFRDAENFPGTELVSSIYAVGGEWHGYTWLDQTTYFATAPVKELDLLLRIEADRMARLLIPADKVRAESGAILTEMHGYENDPASVLHDQVLYLSFLAHPYRNNTIGWESDVSHISHEELVDFYQRHYHPGNTVLAVVGDIRTEDVLRRVREQFGMLQGRALTPEPHTIEPAQLGERRTRMLGELDRKYFKIAYRAPSAINPDFAAFLLAQDLLAGGSGISFLQNDWGTPARADSPLAGITEDLVTWFPPSAQDYVFTIGGSVSSDADEIAIEKSIEAGIEGLRRSLIEDDPSGAVVLEQARQRVLRELVFDIQTTEDAAHQLAFFTGLDALDVLTGLPEALSRVSTADIKRAMDSYLRPEQRTIGWFVPATSGELGRSKLEIAQDRPGSNHERQRKVVAVSKEPAAPAILSHLENGIPVIIQRSPLSATATLKVIIPSVSELHVDGARANEPNWGVSSLDFDLLPDELGDAVLRARKTLESPAPGQASARTDSSDPEVQLGQYFQKILGLEPANGEMPLVPLLLVVCGDIDPSRVLPQLETVFGNMPPATNFAPPVLQVPKRLDVESSALFPIAQEQLGYVVQAPGPGDPAVAAWQMALYILSHGYEGRLGTEAITRRGLVYYIDSAYNTNGQSGWITLSIGVDPDKLPAMKELLQEELTRLVSEPPSQQEVDEARQHLLGRHVSAAQSNRELAGSLARQWFWYTKLLDYDELENQLSAVQRQDIIDFLPAFIAGSTVVIRNARLEHDSPINANQ